MCVIQIFTKGSRELLSCGLFGNIVLLFLQIWEVTVSINMQPQPTKDGPADWGLGVGYSSSL